MREISSGLGSVASRRFVGVAAACAGPAGPEDVVDEEDADEVVEVVVHDGEAAVAGGPHGLGDVLGVHRDGEVGDVDPWRHHLAHVHVAQVGQRLDDDALLLGGLGLQGLVLAVGPAGLRRRRRSGARVVVIAATRRRRIRVA